MMRSASPLLIGLSAVMVAIQDDMPLVLVTRRGSEDAKIKAAIALTFLALNGANAAAIVKHGITSPREP